MSDVLLIKGMKMPKSCPCELVGVGYDMCCTFAYGVPSRVREYYECCEKETMPEWCPLVEMPSADVVEVRHGKWGKGNMPTYGGYKCSVCGENTLHYKANFCPNCGADMRGKT